MARLHNKINKKKLKEDITLADVQRTTLSFYKYHPIDQPHQFRDHLYRSFSTLDVMGRVYVAHEGINAQISLPTDHLEPFKKSLEEFEFLKNVRLNIAIEDDGKSFYVLKIKVRKKIVADGLDQSFSPENGGEHINAAKFNALTSSNETIVVDMRNHYESEVGHFENAICPDVETFKQSLSIVEDLLAEKKDKEIIMYCTGGIRCEKATAYFKTRGFKKLYQLDGGIIEYTRQVTNQGLENKFKGKNFVFDERLGERISNEIIARCHQCGDACDQHINCANDACHLLFIQCEKCARKFSQCCSKKCQEFNGLSAEEQAERKSFTKFNGSKFGKGRYKAHRTTDHDRLK